ncbi:hypothetical protein C8R44DRAFT_747583 [Mycena epipterygia]|nr:hypothetical protein C8R44DRAFT_747583 [Mycena epipterygia]
MSRRSLFLSFSLCFFSSFLLPGASVFQAVGGVVFALGVVIAGISKHCIIGQSRGRKKKKGKKSVCIHRSSVVYVRSGQRPDGLVRLYGVTVCSTSGYLQGLSADADGGGQHWVYEARARAGRGEEARGKAHTMRTHRLKKGNCLCDHWHGGHAMYAMQWTPSGFQAQS